MTTPANNDPAVDDRRWHDARLRYQPPLALHALMEFLDLRAVPGVEQVADGVYRRAMRMPGGLGVVSLGPGGVGAGRSTGDGGEGADSRAPWVACRMWLDDPRDRPVALAACRRLLDLDADPNAVDAALASDPLLAPLVAATPGRRAPGSVDADELAVRAVLGQQVSLTAARRLAGRLAELCGDRLPDPGDDVIIAFPSPTAIAEADLDQIGMPGSRRATLRSLARTLADGRISLAPGADPDEAERKLLEIRGIGPWTAAYIRMRGLGDRDVLLTTDLGVRHALARLGADDADDVARRWSPWGSYAVQHLWASLANG